MRGLKSEMSRSIMQHTLPGQEMSSSLLDNGGLDVNSVSVASMYSNRARSQFLLFKGCINNETLPDFETQVDR